MIRPPYPFSLDQHRHKAIILESLNNAFEEVSGEKAVNHVLDVNKTEIRVRNERYPLHPQGKVYLLAVGKAAISMTKGALSKLSSIIQQGLVVTKGRQEQTIPKIEIVYGDHPVPGINSINAARKVDHFLRQIQPNDTLLCLISGGASALITYPQPPISLEDLSSMTHLLLSCGASIEEINCLRKHLEIFKGGGLVKRVPASQIISLIISDVTGDDISTIASGMTSPDPTTFQVALEILSTFNLLNEIPSSIKIYILQGVAGDIPETAKPDDPLFQRVSNHIIASNYLACQAVQQTMQRYGFNTMHLTSCLKGEAREVGKIMASFAREHVLRDRSLQRPFCWVAGGETTVTIKGSGIGGRNLELALGAVQDFGGLGGAALITLATDGEDGKSPAAGAIVDGNTLVRARCLGMNPIEYLRNNDSFTFFSSLNDVFYTFPTQTNVNDLVLLILE